MSLHTSCELLISWIAAWMDKELHEKRVLSQVRVG